MKLKTNLFKSNKYHIHPILCGDICSSAREVKRLEGKKSILFVMTDNNNPPECSEHKDLIVFRTALEKSKRLKNERVLPFLWSKNYDFSSPISPKDKPSVGFCGVARGRWYHNKRSKIVNQFKSNQRIETNAILRNRFCNGKLREAHPELVVEYEKNLEENIFNLCYRGAGNFSCRFYEVLAAGRIPILIKSDTELPFENEIDWENVVIMADDSDKAMQKLLSVWNSRCVMSMQRECRKIYEKYFNEESFYSQICKEL